MFRTDRKNGHRGGVLLYVKCKMSTVEVKFKNEFSKQIWCKVQVRNGEDLLIGVCYRTPNESISQKDNNKFLCDMIAELHGKPLLLMGDFNFPNVDWSTSHGPTPASHVLCGQY